MKKKFKPSLYIESEYMTRQRIKDIKGEYDREGLNNETQKMLQNEMKKNERLNEFYVHYGVESESAEVELYNNVICFIINS